MPIIVVHAGVHTRCVCVVLDDLQGLRGHSRSCVVNPYVGRQPVVAKVVGVGEKISSPIATYREQSTRAVVGVLLRVVAGLFYDRVTQWRAAVSLNNILIQDIGT